MPHYHSSAPGGCLQYFTGTSGQVKTFNFDATEGTHLRNQVYSSCIRQEAGRHFKMFGALFSYPKIPLTWRWILYTISRSGYCCVEYSVCKDEGSFSLYTNDGTSLLETECTSDYVRIEGAASSCQAMPLAHINKFCGDFLSTTTGLNAGNDIVCDCSAPFAVGISTDELSDDGTAGTANDAAAARSKGLCLNYKQIPC